MTLPRHMCPGCRESTAEPGTLCERCFSEECPFCGEENCQATCTGAMDAVFPGQMELDAS